MIALCKKCTWRCKVVLYDGNVAMHTNQCYIRIDACSEEDPSDIDTGTCDYFELRKSLRKSSVFKEALDYVREKKNKEK